MINKNAIQALTELLNSRSEWVRTRAIVINQEISRYENNSKNDYNGGVPEDSFYYGCEQSRGWSGDWYAHHGD